ncbi:MAG TPA: threonine--tRNA ligase [Bacilli bacterium]|jgi:threonyl-tRNA synthetase|nr:threonine--tRNA ligase [Acholeplasmataceae bacterium]HNZ77749.1 threonine--tRNA ligase [Bacilli bacterium]HOH61129.1 threonine--tRNA ligase [Bacilli bacterium]HPM14854.1 threonine--tRNA ligase [Bacilli bacterium]HPY54611.1 threonine--tRNA ligase [Bacilli bacterium]
MKITFLDGSIKEFNKGTSALEIASSISSSLAKKSVCAKINGKLYDLKRPIEEDATLELITKEDPEAQEVLNHSCSHLLASAVKKLYPQACFGVGPAIEEGFYYDINPGNNVKITEEDLVKIEKEMKHIAASDVEFKRIEVSKKQALELFKEDKYKMEIISELPETETITCYQHAEFIDLCRGPHVTSTKWLKFCKLLAISGAYWRGDSKNEQLQRIYGTCFFSEEELNKHLENLKEREARDHRKLGRELELFMLSEYGPGFPFWLPKGMVLRKQLEDYWFKVHTREGYQFIQTPIMLNKELWEISGHWTNYRENMYTSEIDKHEFAIKPMNCPGGMLVYKHSLHSYKDLPLRIGELGLVHRHEASGALNGLFRVRNFTQDDAHIFMRPDQIVTEVGNLIKLFEEVYSVFNLSYHIELSTRPEHKYIGSIEIWDQAEAALADACRSVQREYKINPGDGAFYGPKLDFKLKDSMNRIWQCGTIQLDMNLPERFDLTYIDENGEKKRPVMLHRALFGSIERFIGVITEHFGGAFPIWLAPVQVKLIPVSNEHHLEYVQKLKDQLFNENIRCEIDEREEKLGYKIREAQTKKIPYQLVCGDNEVNNNLITYRKYGSNQTTTVTTGEFITMIKQEIQTMGR